MPVQRDGPQRSQPRRESAHPVDLARVQRNDDPRERERSQAVGAHRDEIDAPEHPAQARGRIGSRRPRLHGDLTAGRGLEARDHPGREHPRRRGEVECALGDGRRRRGRLGRDRARGWLARDARAVAPACARDRGEGERERAADPAAPRAGQASARAPSRISRPVSTCSSSATRGTSTRITFE